MAWKPIGAATNFHDTLHPGVPVWMAQELIVWASHHTSVRMRNDWALMYDSASRNADPIAPTMRNGFEALIQHRDGDEVISFLDYFVHLNGLWADDIGLDREDVQRLDALGVLLERCGSAWRIGTRDGYWGLERRVPEGVQEAADHVATTTGSAGALLSEAWHAAFGVTPDAEEAYEKAIKAVEESGAKVILPKNPKATLGTMIATMRPHGDWALEITDSNGNHFNDLVLRMCEALWQGQGSRHGGNGYRKPTQGEAEAAVMLAAPLVQWFHAGAVARR